MGNPPVDIDKALKKMQEESIKDMVDIWVAWCKKLLKKNE